MDSCGGCGPGDEGERLEDLGKKQDLSSSTTKLSQPPMERDRARTSSDKLLAGDRWSQEENNAVTPREVLRPSHTLPITNGVVTVNGIHKAQSGHTVQTSGVSTQSSERHSEQSLLNNNLIEEKCNLRCADEKSYCLYHKFPAKVNNNVYPEKGTSVKDGMDEYFQMYASINSSKQLPQQQPIVRCNELSPSRDPPRYPDQLNLLNGEEEDEDDGCIYTYKGENFEANLSHLIDMCLSCGLPNTERGVDDRGAMVHRLRSTRPDPPEQNNLFSPDMDFLEMDFDPGPNGDGDVDSDCEDNCVDECDSRLLNREHATAFSVAGALNPISVLDRKANNYCSEMRNLMCKRCESSICDGKIDNVALNLSVHENHSTLNIGRGPSAGLDDRPSARSSPLNVPRDGMNLPKDLNVELNEFCDVQNKAIDGPTPQADDDEYDPPDNDSVENNLGDVDIMDMIDDFCEDADDEDGDDSNSERYDLGARFSRPSGGSEAAVREREDRGSGHISSGKYINKTTNKTNNNNLGSVSAPEVSPAKEYSPLEKFGRSISFHNQLSSPKYENVCFSHRPKKEEQLCDAQTETAIPTEVESANLEACAGRLHRRENSVFNILSDPATSQSGSSGCRGVASGTSVESTLVSVGQHTSMISTQAAPSAASHPSGHTSMPPMTGLLMTTTGNTTCTVIAGGGPCPLPVKSLRPKNTNPTQDPNTASEGEGGGEESCPRVKKVMIWTELQASARQVTQIATSACGATAIINVLLALDYPNTVEEVQKSIQTRLRAEIAPVVNYLFSRSVAGTSHRDLINGVTQLSQGAIKAKFFHMFPKRAVQLSRWLAHWISRGGVPLATLNLQVGVPPGQTIPDAWHHQMIFGVGPQGIYLTNPLECVSDCLLGDQLCTDSVLLVRRADVVGRWGQGDRLIRLTQHPDTRWRDMNVLGQVVGVLKEQAAPPVVQGRRHLTSHVAIPAAYQSGVTIFMRSDNPQLHTLMQAEELPLLE
ncbi:uncharacterized protein LOC121877357 isoform X2 [Homarus americanus]|uniref:uncharacterized protein LOC121877357 isoform X2 n=1 Tax=Homarus americanus TaxID=6706 RepID=UPI001C44CE10|nr:uncharacterized protein LOC121877357 isoform X2 [Homarus americanus]